MFSLVDLYTYTCKRTHTHECRSSSIEIFLLGLTCMCFCTHTQLCQYVHVACLSKGRRSLVGYVCLSVYLSVCQSVSQSVFLSIRARARVLPFPLRSFAVSARPQFLNRYTKNQGGSAADGDAWTGGSSRDGAAEFAGTHTVL